MMEGEAVLMKPKHQCHLSQYEEWDYGAQSWKQWRLLCESMFVPLDKWTITLKNDGKRSFSFETKALISFILMRRISLWCAIMKGNAITMWICVCPNWQITLTLKVMEKEAFLLKPKH